MAPRTQLTQPVDQNGVSRRATKGGAAATAFGCLPPVLTRLSLRPTPYSPSPSAAAQVNASAEWEAASAHSSLRSWRLPARAAMNDTIIRHRYSDPATEPAPLKVGIPARGRAALASCWLHS